MRSYLLSLNKADQFNPTANQFDSTVKRSHLMTIYNILIIEFLRKENRSVL